MSCRTGCTSEEESFVCLEPFGIGIRRATTRPAASGWDGSGRRHLPPTREAQGSAARGDGGWLVTEAGGMYRSHGTNGTFPFRSLMGRVLIQVVPPSTTGS